MTSLVRQDDSNRIVLPRDLRAAAGFLAGQKLKGSAFPGRIVLEARSNMKGKLVKRGKLKVWTGAVSSKPLADAVELSRTPSEDVSRPSNSETPNESMKEHVKLADKI